MSERAGAVRFDVVARPRAPKTAIKGVREGALWVALAAVPEDGRANQELCRGIAAALRIRRQDVSVVAGQSGRRKVVEARGVDAATVCARLAPDDS